MTIAQKITTAKTASIIALLLTVTLLTPSSTKAIVRVKVAPEVGHHIFQLDLGGAGSFESFPGDKGFSWSAGWTYHADNTLGLGVTVGRNSPETNVYFTDRELADYEFSYFTATIQVRAPTRKDFIPHVQAGFGKYNLNIDRVDLSTNLQLPTVEVDDFGMFFGLGVDYLVVPNVSIGIIGNYHFVSISDSISGQAEGLGEWYNTWDIKAVISLYAR